MKEFVSSLNVGYNIDNHFFIYSDFLPNKHTLKVWEGEVIEIRSERYGEKINNSNPNSCNFVIFSSTCVTVLQPDETANKDYFENINGWLKSNATGRFAIEKSWRINPYRGSTGEQWMRGTTYNLCLTTHLSPSFMMH